ncbi:MAG: Ig-like domain-containing protein [Pseudomonadota bacterium]
MHILRTCFLWLACVSAGVLSGLAALPAWAAAAKAPTVSLTAPANGASFNVPANITLTATAAVSGATIARVDFYRAGTTLIGSATAAPYTITWSGAPAGSHTLTAKATSSAGASTTSAAVTITVKTQPPTVFLTSPASGAAYSAPASISLAANAADPDGTVQRVDYYAGSSLVATSTTAPFSATWSNVGAGAYTLTARATDNAGAQTTSSPVTVSVAAVNQPPLLAITSPIDCVPVTSQFSIQLSADAVDPDGTVSRVEFYEGATLLGAVGNANIYADTRNAFNMAWAPRAGTYTVTAKAYDNKGASTTSAPVTVTLVDPPVVSLTSPAYGANTSIGANVVLVASATVGSGGGSIAKVEFFAGGQLVGTSSTAPYSVTWRPTSAGSVPVFVRATDTAGFSTNSQQIIVNVSANPPPVVSLTSPLSSATFVVGQSVPLAASASASGASVVKVEFYAGVTLVGTATAAPYAGSWTPSVAGSYAITAKATDSLGASTVSAPMNVVVSASPPPTVSLVAPAAGAVYATPGTVTFTANAVPAEGGAAIAQVAYFVGSNFIGNSTTAPYTLLWPAPSVGSYTVTARVTDTAGMQGTSAVVTINVVASPPPSVTLGSPVAGSTYTAPASITLSASAAAAASGGSISKVDFYQGAALLGTASAAPYLYTWTGVPAGTYAVTAVATDSVGVQASTPAVTVTVGSLSIAFMSPAEGTAVSGTEVLVQGTVQGPANYGVTVNGAAAMVDASNKFYAAVPLTAGANAITATLTAPTGQTATQTINVTSDGVAPAITITADQSEGVQTLTVTFTASGGDGASMSNISWSGSGVTFAQSGDALVLNFSQPGKYTVQGTAVDAAGSTVVKDFVIVVQDAAVLDAKLKALWSGMNAALVAGDKATALNYLSPAAQEKYGPVFDALQPVYEQVISTWSAPITGTLSGSIGEYGVITTSSDGARQLFLINFIRGADGVWRLESM